MTNPNHSELASMGDLLQISFSPVPNEITEQIAEIHTVHKNTPKLPGQCPNAVLVNDVTGRARCNVSNLK
jgi:hypothetical protein